MSSNTGFPRPCRVVSLHLTTAPDLPDSDTCSLLVSSYFKTVNLMYPFVQKTTMDNIVPIALEHGLEHLTHRYGIAILMQVYLVLLLGSHAQPNILQPLQVERLQGYCKTLYGHVLSDGNLEGSRALALLALQYKYQGNDNAAWLTLSQCISLAKSLDMIVPRLNYQRDSASRKLKDLTDGERLWWTLYCLEKLFAFELGRSSSSLEPHLHQSRILTSTPGLQSEGMREFSIIISLADVLHQISTQCVRAGAREENSPEPQAIRAAVIAKVRASEECCMLLSEWTEGVPVPFRYVLFSCPPPKRFLLPLTLLAQFAAVSDTLIPLNFKRIQI